MPVQNLLDDNNSLPQEKSIGRKVESKKSLGVLKNIENFEHNLAKSGDFDDGRI